MKILIVRIGRLGDIVMILPAIGEIQQQYPEAELYVLTSQDGVRLLKAYGLSSEQMHCYSNQLLKRAQQVHAARTFVAQHHFDKIFCFEHKRRTVSWLPASATVINDSYKEEHYARRCLRLVTAEPSACQAKPYMPVPDYDISAQLHAQGIKPDTILVGLHPTYSGFNKWGRKEEKIHRLWPERSFAALVDAIAMRVKNLDLDIRFIMDLLPEEYRIGQRIQALCANDIIVQCAPPNFQRYLAYLNRLDVVVAPNTGVMHLAAALNTPTVALFSGLDPEDCGPYMHKSRYRVIESQSFGEPPFRMENIPVEAVEGAAFALLPQIQLR